MKRTKTIIITAILFLAIFFFAALQRYLTPKHKFISTTLCSQDGECIDVILDVTWYRHLFAPTELKDTITADNKLYQSFNVNSGDNFIEKINEKLHPSSIFRFIAWPMQNHWIYEQQIWLFYADRNSDTRNFNLICMVFIPGGGQGGRNTIYYGPSATAEEADAILSKIVTGSE